MSSVDPEKVAALFCTKFVGVPKSKCWRIKYNGICIRTPKGKTMWGSQGAAKSGLRNYIRTLFDQEFTYTRIGEPNNPQVLIGNGSIYVSKNFPRCPVTSKEKGEVFKLVYQEVLKKVEFVMVD